MKTLTFSQLKSIYSFCEENNIDDVREVVENIVTEESDFEVNDFRFIDEDEIDSIQVDELEADPYILGCFNDWFIADNSDLSIDIVQALQQAEKFEAIGQHLIDNDNVKDLQKEYASADGYGHHFSSYDGETLEDLLHLGYYAFRLN